MLYHKPLQDFKIISFDLDDTLYDNGPVIKRAEQHFLQYLRESTQVTAIDTIYWRSWKNKIYQQDPILCEDVTKWRLQALIQMLQFHQQSPTRIEQISKKAMDIFLQWRNIIDIPNISIMTLKQLRQYYPLVALTNGNVDPMAIGLDDFDLILKGGLDGRAKPHPELFLAIAKHYDILPQQILHVGDSLITDVGGAIKAGCQAVWLNTTNNPSPEYQDEFPHLEIQKIEELLKLI